VPARAAPGLLPPPPPSGRPRGTPGPSAQGLPRGPLVSQPLRRFQPAGRMYEPGGALAVLGPIPRRPLNAPMTVRIPASSASQLCSRPHCRSRASCTGSIVCSPVSLEMSVQAAAARPSDRRAAALLGGFPIFAPRAGVARPCRDRYQPATGSGRGEANQAALDGLSGSQGLYQPP